MERQSEDWESRHLPHCPRCEQIELRRHGRVGFLQRTVLPMFGLYPWECGLCRKIYMLRQRSRGYSPAETEIAAPGPPAQSQPRLEVVPQVRNSLADASVERNRKAAL